MPATRRISISPEQPELRLRYKADGILVLTTVGSASHRAFTTLLDALRYAQCYGDDQEVRLTVSNDQGIVILRTLV